MEKKQTYKDYVPKTKQCNSENHFLLQNVKLSLMSFQETVAVFIKIKKIYILRKL